MPDSYSNPFRSEGRWYKGNTHAHSTVSDGVLSVPELFEGYRGQGYDFLVLTDHGKVSDVSGYTDGSFLAIPGSELHPENPYGGTRYHIVAINIARPVGTDGRHPIDVMSEVTRLGGVSVLAHPYWSGHTVQDLLPLHGHFAVEVFNTTCEKIGRSTSESHWDDLLGKTTPLLGIASDDCHFLWDMYRGWVMVKSPELSAGSIVDSLVHGSFYATQGPEILDFGPSDGPAGLLKNGARSPLRVIAKFSPSVTAAFKAAPCKGKFFRAEQGELLTEAWYDITGEEKYVRLEITAADGRKAWSQPLVLERLLAADRI